MAQNNDWEKPELISGGAPVATAAELATMSVTAGAFPLGGGSKDAALIVTLPPGVFTAVLSGANKITGAGMVEVYLLTADAP